MTRRRYVLISPCRNEARYLPVTIQSVGAQTVLPAKWVIVDDGSTDQTPEILRAGCEKYPFIEVVRREDRGRRVVGPGVIESFYAGLDGVDLDQYDYLCKLDTDLEIPPRYFETVMEQFEAEPRLGTFSGKTYLRLEGGREVSERLGDENSIGPAKFYRVGCFRDIGGFEREVSWDGIDGHRCRQRGWVARSSDGVDLRLIHLRQMGSSHRGIWTGRLRWGRGKWYMGSSWYYVLGVSLFRMFERPYVLGGFGILCGYLREALTGGRRFDDEAFRKHLRRYELRSLIFGKRRTEKAYHKRITGGDTETSGGSLRG